MDRGLKKLATAAWRASRKCKWSCYPMAPGLNLTDREVSRHRPALEAHGVAAKAFKAAGMEAECREHEAVLRRHSDVIHGVGCV